MAQLEVNLPPINLINFNRLRFWMPDIAMCMGRDCPKKNTCYRYTAFPSEYRQSYFVGVPYEVDSSDENAGCTYYWPEKEEHEDRSGHRDGSIPQEDSSGSNKES